MDDFSRDLLHRVKCIRQSDQEKARPLFFICHSLGGLLFKQALNLAHQDPENYRDMLERFTGVVFMGTPHGGADVAFWASYAGRLLNAASLGTRTNVGLLQVLRKDSKFLGTLSHTFALQNGSLKIITFYETEKFPMLNGRVCKHCPMLCQFRCLLLFHTARLWRKNLLIWSSQMRHCYQFMQITETCVVFRMSKARSTAPLEKLLFHWFELLIRAKIVIPHRSVGAQLISLITSS